MRTTACLLMSSKMRSQDFCYRQIIDIQCQSFWLRCWLIKMDIIYAPLTGTSGARFIQLGFVLLVLRLVIVWQMDVSEARFQRGRWVRKWNRTIPDILLYTIAFTLCKLGGYDPGLRNRHGMHFSMYAWRLNDRFPCACTLCTCISTLDYDMHRCRR